MITEDVQKRFLYFVEERENIRLSREVFDYSPPFTEDKVLQEFRFCNINREHDAVTRWVAKNVRSKLSGGNVMYLICAMLTCRIFNEPETLKLMDFSVFDIEAWFIVAKRKQKEGERVLRGAYMMPAHGINGKGVGVVDYYERVTLELSTRDALYEAKTLRAVAEEMDNVRGLGVFLANQVISDLRYTDNFKYSSDWETFILCGPGTRRGINRFDGVSTEKIKSQDFYVQRILQIKEMIMPQVSRLLQDYYRDINNLSNSFCEFDKYERALDAVSQYKQPRLRKWK